MTTSRSPMLATPRFGDSVVKGYGKKRPARVESGAPATSTTSPPRPPSPPSGPPRGTCASRRKEIAPFPPRPPSTTTRARSTNTLRLDGLRSRERAQREVGRVGAISLDHRGEAEEPMRRLEHRERALRVGIQVSQLHHSAGQRAEQRDERVDLFGSIGKPG